VTANQQAASLNRARQ